jgi:hypothetical protein
MAKAGLESVRLRRAMANGKWQMANGKWQMANGRWQMADGLVEPDVGCCEVCGGGPGKNSVAVSGRAMLGAPFARVGFRARPLAGRWLGLPSRGEYGTAAENLLVRLEGFLKIYVRLEGFFVIFFLWPHGHK